MTKLFYATILAVLAIVAMSASGCNRQNANANNDERAIDSAVVVSDTTIVRVDSVTEQADSVVEQIVRVFSLMYRKNHQKTPEILIKTRA